MKRGTVLAAARSLVPILTAHPAISRREAGDYLISYLGLPRDKDGWKASQTIITFAIKNDLVSIDQYKRLTAVIPSTKCVARTGLTYRCGLSAFPKHDTHRDTRFDSVEWED